MHREESAAEPRGLSLSVCTYLHTFRIYRGGYTERRDRGGCVESGWVGSIPAWVQCTPRGQPFSLRRHLAYFSSLNPFIHIVDFALSSLFISFYLFSSLFFHATFVTPLPPLHRERILLPVLADRSSSRLSVGEPRGTERNKDKSGAVAPGEGCDSSRERKENESGLLADGHSTNEDPDGTNEESLFTFTTVREIGRGFLWFFGAENPLQSASDNRISLVRVLFCSFFFSLPLVYLSGFTKFRKLSRALRKFVHRHSRVCVRHQEIDQRVL